MSRETAWDALELANSGAGLQDEQVEACRSVAEAGRKLAALLDDKTDEIEALCEGYNDVLTALVAQLLYEDGLFLVLPQLGMPLKQQVMAAFYLGYQARGDKVPSASRREEGDG